MTGVTVRRSTNTPLPPLSDEITSWLAWQSDALPIRHIPLPLMRSRHGWRDSQTLYQYATSPYLWWDHVMTGVTVRRSTNALHPPLSDEITSWLAWQSDALPIRHTHPLSDEITSWLAWQSDALPIRHIPSLWWDHVMTGVTVRRSTNTPHTPSLWWDHVMTVVTVRRSTNTPHPPLSDEITSWLAWQSDALPIRHIPCHWWDHVMTGVTVRRSTNTPHPLSLMRSRHDWRDSQTLYQYATSPSLWWDHVMTGVTVRRSTNTPHTPYLWWDHVMTGVTVRRSTNTPHPPLSLMRSCHDWRDSQTFYQCATSPLSDEITLWLAWQSDVLPMRHAPFSLKYWVVVNDCFTSLFGTHGLLGDILIR